MDRVTTKQNGGTPAATCAADRHRQAASEQCPPAEDQRPPADDRLGGWPREWPPLLVNLPRIIGIGLIVALVVVALGSYRRTVGSAGDDRAERPETAREGTTDDAVVAEARSGDEPQYLAFVPGVRPGIHQVAEVEGSGDRDVRPSEPAGLDYPIETELAAGQSLGRGGTSVEPGLYATAFGISDCSYQLRSIMEDRRDAVIGEDRILRGRMLVTINEIEPDTFSAVPQCGDWAPWSPLVEPLAVAGDGDYWIGDLAKGTWSVPEGCLWEKVVGFRGAELYDIQASGSAGSPLVVDDETLGVRIRGCDRPLRLEPGRS